MNSAPNKLVFNTKPESWRPLAAWVRGLLLTNFILLIAGSAVLIARGQWAAIGIAICGLIFVFLASAWPHQIMQVRNRTQELILAAAIIALFLCLGVGLTILIT